MGLTLKFSRHSIRSIFSIATILMGSLAGFAQTPQFERSFPTDGSLRIAISNAWIISIKAWDKNEISITAEAFGAKVNAEEVSIKSEKKGLEIKCRPSRPGKNISLNFRVPAKAVLELNLYDSKILVKEPAGPISIMASKKAMLINAPESSEVDLLDAPQTVRRPQMPLPNKIQVIGGSRFGTGPPYLKVSATKTYVVLGLGPVESFAQPPTSAAQTIARGDSSMSRALRRAHPRLISPSARPDQTASPNSMESEEGALKLKTHLVNLNLSVTDREGKAISALKQEDFSVYEDGVLQRISFFSPEHSPFNLVLLLDMSGSVRDKIDLIKEMAFHFFDVMSPQDSVAVIAFTTDVVAVSHLTRDRDDLRRNVRYMQAPVGGTSFYDALGYVLIEELRKVKGQRNAVIAITDGEDNAIQASLLAKLSPADASIGMFAFLAGSFLTFDQLLDGVMEADALIYPIHLSPVQPQSRSNLGGPMAQIQPEVTEIAVKRLQSLAQASGGRFYHADRLEDLKGVFELVAAELRTVYSLAYSPTNLNFDGSFRNVRVEVNKPDTAVRTRQGYYGR